MKVKDLLKLSEGLTDISTQTFPTKTTLKIYTLNKDIADALEVPMKVRQELIEKHAGKKHDDGSVDIDPNTLDEFNKEFNELMNEDIEIELKKINLSEIEHIELAPRTLALLENIIEFEEEEGADKNE